MTEERFAPEVYQIEEEIVNQFITSPMFSGRDDFFVRLLGLFITRKKLTQSEIHRITGISRGKISQELNHFLEDGLIEVANVSENGKITYRSKSAVITMLRFSRSIVDLMVSWEEKLKIKYAELLANKGELSKLKGYDRLVEMYSFMEKSIGGYRNFDEKTKEILENLESELK